MNRIQFLSTSCPKSLALLLCVLLCGCQTVGEWAGLSSRQPELQQIESREFSLLPGQQEVGGLYSNRITNKKVNPSWVPPLSIHREQAENGDPPPPAVPPGPENPLGNYALRLSMPGYLIHGARNRNGAGSEFSSINPDRFIYED